MDKTLTTEELFKGIPIPDDVKKHFSVSLIEFAKLHVTRALMAAADNASVESCNCSHPNYCTGECKNVDKNSILTAYPLENIV